jgi:hypothetical protein
MRGQHNGQRRTSLENVACTDVFDNDAPSLLQGSAARGKPVVHCAKELKEGRLKSLLSYYIKHAVLEQLNVAHVSTGQLDGGV